MKKNLLTATAISLLALQPHYASATDSFIDVGGRITKLEDEIALLKRQQEVQEEKNTANVEKTANVDVGSNGLKITSPDKNYELSLKGLFQFDTREFLNDKAETGRDDILARRLRPILEGKAGDASFRFMPDFAGSTPRVFDAYVEYKLSDPLQLRFGKFKTPIGLERLQAAADTLFIERGHPTNLVPNRDLGLMAYGNLIQDVLEYQVGVFDGNQDLGNTDNDSDNKKDIAGRIFVKPLRNSDYVALQGFGIGIGGSIGDQQGSTAQTILGTYKTPGQQDFFHYNTGTYADGGQWRLYPQAYWYYGNKGLIAEYAVSNQEVTRTINHADLQTSAWQLAGSYVLTGEDVNFAGGIKPYQNFNLKKGGIGAWEIVARVGETDIDKKAFSEGFSDITVSASKARSYGTGINWYLNQNFKLAANYEITQFDEGASGGGNRPEEQVILTRAQFRF